MVTWLPDLLHLRRLHPETISTSTEQASGLVEQHLVESGESLWQIAQDYYGDPLLYPALAAANNLDSQAKLRVGQVIELPVLQVASQDQTSQDKQLSSSTFSVEYEVAPDDCLWSIAQAELGDPYRWPEIYQLNRNLIGSNPDLILPKQKLQLPTG